MKNIIQWAQPRAQVRAQVLKITSAMLDYVSERRKDIERKERERYRNQREKEIEERGDNRISYAEYIEIKHRADAGDEEARKMLISP